MGNQYDTLEKDRLDTQACLDSKKTQLERNKLGQFSTPTILARDMLNHAYSLLPKHQKVSFLDPAIGTGAFYSALQNIFPDNRIRAAVGYEIDRHYAEPAIELWNDTKLNIHIADFTTQPPQKRFDLVICNPPYVRHHHIPSTDKARLQIRSHLASGHQLGGLAGLYCHFMLQANMWMNDGAIAGWLIPSEFMDVNYGIAAKHYLLETVTLLQIHRFDPNDVQFADALVSSAVVWIQNTPPPKGHRVRFTFGGSLSQPRIDRTVPVSILGSEHKWTRFPKNKARNQPDGPVIGDLFKIRRGIATGGNKHFILTDTEIHRRQLPMQFFKPILPSPRYLTNDIVLAGQDGAPNLDQRLFLLDIPLTESEIKKEHSSLWAYLQEIKSEGIHERYLCRHRSPWYSQEKRPTAPIVCTYMGRGDTKSKRPFRFILNESNATVANVYLAMYATPTLQTIIDADPDIIRVIWSELNALKPEDLLCEGRVYGGGLHKLEPKELAKVAVPNLAQYISNSTKNESCLFDHCAAVEVQNHPFAHALTH